jgi:thiol-disulfide isomerase/thioredoxin
LKEIKPCIFNQALNTNQKMNKIQIKIGLALLVFFVQTFVFAQKKIELIPLYQANGKTSYLKGFQNHKANVLWFFSPECPLCQQYTLTIKNLQKQFGNQVQWIGIESGKNSKQSIAFFFKKYGLNMPYLIDKNMHLGKTLKARITPEVFVFNSNCQLTYSGRIDNWAYAPGKTRPNASIHDLRNQLQLLMQKQHIPYTSKTAIGCFIE